MVDARSHGLAPRHRLVASFAFPATWSVVTALVSLAWTAGRGPVTAHGARLEIGSIVLLSAVLWAPHALLSVFAPSRWSPRSIVSSVVASSVAAVVTAVLGFAALELLDAAGIVETGPARLAGIAVTALATGIGMAVVRRP